MTRLVLERHVERGDGKRVALRHIDVDGQKTELTYGGLLERSARFANVLRELGIRRGDRVFSLLGRTPELWIAALGTIAAGGVYCPLFSSFGPEPVRARLRAGDARFLVTSLSLYRERVAPIAAQVPGLEHVLCVGSPAAADDVSADVALHGFAERLAAASSEIASADSAAEEPALLFFTSGTTGEPKGAVHVQEALVAQYATARSVLGLGVGDLFWCTADPGWVTGTVYGILAPLAVGVTVLVDQGEFDALRWLRLLRDQQVNIWYTAPTAIRRLMRVKPETVRAHRPDHLRLAASVGEPLGAAAVLWGAEMLGRPFHDTWWQTETGAIMIANLVGEPVQAGSMGRAVPGVEAAAVQRNEQGQLEEVPEGSVGELALRTPWPSMFRGYIGDEERYAARFSQGWYLSGDLVRRDGEGVFRFVARDDDAIQSSGHLIGPVEIEQTLRAHPAVAEAAAIGKPDAVAGERVKAFVTLCPGWLADDELRIELLAYARERLGAAVTPRELDFRDSLPMTTSGKIVRRQLRDEELATAASPAHD